MDFHFTGSSRPARTINLGRQGPPLSVSDIAARARSARNDRHQHRRQAAAATRIQSAYRAYVVARAWRQTWALEFDRITSPLENFDTWIHFTRLAVFCQSPKTLDQASRLATWSRLALQTDMWIEQDSWLVLLPMALRVAIRALTLGVPSPEDAQAFFALIARVLTGRHGIVQYIATRRMLEDRLLLALRTFFVTLPKTATQDQALCVDAMLAPLRLFPALPSPRTQGTTDEKPLFETQFLSQFTNDVLTIPNLLQCMPIESVTKFSASFPVDDVMEHICALGAYYDVTTGKSTLPSNPIHCPYLLANLIPLVTVRVKSMSGPQLSRYLAAMTILLNANDRSVFADRSATNARAFSQLSMMVSYNHLQSIFIASKKYATSSRPVLFSFLVAITQAWPAHVADNVLLSALYGFESRLATSNAPLGALVRELWRGWIRSSSLARAISTPSLSMSFHADDIRREILRSDYASEWPLFLLLCMLYGRCLLTLGDDEFYPTLLPSSSDPPKNPLSMDELVELCRILRNLAFALIWTEEPEFDEHVPGTRMPLGEAQKVATHLLRQLHSRDARRPFVPPDQWHILYRQDLASFARAVLLEDQDLHSSRKNGAAPSYLTDRTRAFMSPRLNVLEQIPFVIPFKVRVDIFRQFVRTDLERLGISRQLFSRSQKHRATIRRDHIAEDGMTQLYALGPRLKEPLEIVFVDKWGQPEAGIDGGGVFKEFLTSIVLEVFDTDRGLWCTNHRHELYPSPYKYAQEEEQLVWYTFIGRILGKALYEGILVDVKFAGFFLNKWLGHQGYVDELASLESLDKDLYRGLIALKNYTGDVENDFALNFTVTKEEYDQQTVVELIPGGADIPVTRENRLSYIYHMTRYRLSVQIEPQCRAFFAGLSDLIEPRWIKMLDREELRILLCGTESPIDLEDLRRNTVYGGYHEKDLAVQYFWEALSMLDQASLKAFLRFVTSSPNPPLMGFSELNPKFAIRHSSDDTTRLPTASTCVNLLKLPAYSSREQCLEKLRYAIHAGAGFDLS